MTHDTLFIAVIELILKLHIYRQNETDTEYPLIHMN